MTVERVTVTVPLDPFMSLKALSAYSGLSVRKLRQLIDRDPAQALPVYRVDDRVLFGAPSSTSGCNATASVVAPAWWPY